MKRTYIVWIVASVFALTVFLLTQLTSIKLQPIPQHPTIHPSPSHYAVHNLCIYLSSHHTTSIHLSTTLSIPHFRNTNTIPPQLSAIVVAAATATATATSAALPSAPQEQDLQRFGITDDLRSFVHGLTSTTFKHFPVNSDESEFEASDVPTSASNVRKDLNEFQEKHANLVLTTVKEISRLRYELCPRAMKERHFWRIYFTLVNTHVAPYEKQYMEALREAAKRSEDPKVEQTDVGEGSGKAEVTGKLLKSKSSNASSIEQDLDTFLLGDLEDSDGAPDDGEGSFDDDFDKIGNSDVEDEKHERRTSAATV